MTLVDPRLEQSAADTDTAALIKGARRLRRRRWLFGSLLALIAAAAGTAGVLASSASTPATHHLVSVGSSSPGGSAPAAHGFVPTRSSDLIQPTTLAALVDGDLLILDSSRDQILELKRDGSLVVFAGTGRLGSSGDGGPARDAELDFQYFSSAGMTVEPDGSVEFLEDGDCRIREVTTNGVIRTILRLPRARTYPHGTVCPVNGFAVSPSGTIYVAINSEIERVSPQGHLVWVAGAHGPRAYLTPWHVAFFPGALAFDKTGNLYIWNSSPKVIFELSPAGRLEQRGVSYASQLTTAPNGTVFAGTHDGEVDDFTSDGIRPFYAVTPKRIAGINWGSDEGFQEDGIAVTRTGTIYVDNAEGNGFGAATVIVRISPTKHAALVPIRTPLGATLPPVNSPGFPSSLYPAARARHGVGPRCPSEQGLEGFSSRAVETATRIARTYRSAQFASDIAVTDRAFWASDFGARQAGDGFGRHTVVGKEPASTSSASGAITRACGRKLVEDSIAIRVGKSGYSDFVGTLYFLDRDGQPLVYDVR